MRILLCVLSMLIGTASAVAQKPPSNAANNSNGLQSGWQPYSTVNVFIDSAQFPPGSAAESAVKQGFLNNQKAYSSQDITYSFTSVQACPVLNVGEAYVTTESFSDPSQWGNNSWTSTFNSAYGYNFTTTAYITVSPNLLSAPASLTYALSHEDSHDYFLGDCPSCAEGSTIMSYQNDVYSPPFEGPQENDINAFEGFGGANGGTGVCYTPPCRDDQ